MPSGMIKWLYAVVTAATLGVGGIGLTIATTWVNNVNADRAILRELVWKDHYLNGVVSAAPVTTPKK